MATEISSSSNRYREAQATRTESQPEVRNAGIDEQERSQPAVDETDRFESSSALQDEDEDDGRPTLLASSLFADDAKAEQPRQAGSFRNPPGVKSELEGYDPAKLNDPNHRTPKYIFGRVAQSFSLDKVRSKEDGTRLLTEMIPDLKAAGLEVISVEKDILRYRNPETGNIEDIDVIRALGGDRSDRGNTPGWQWNRVAVNGVPEDGGQQQAQQANGAVPPPPNVPMTAELKELEGKFMAVASKYRLDDVATNKDAVGQRLNDMTPELKANGVNVQSACKDQICIQLKDGSFQCIDVVQGAGAAGAKWQWLPCTFPMAQPPQW